MTFGVDGERPGHGRGERIGAMTIVRGALARLQAQPFGGLALWWVLASAALVGVDQGARLAGVDPAGDRPSDGDAYYLIARALVEGLSSALGLRLVLQGRFWLDRGLVVSAAILTAMGLAAGLAIGSPYVKGLSSPAQGALGLIVFYLTLKLTLWPLGPLTGRGDLSLARAWSAMHGATMGMTLAFVLAMVPLFAVGMLYLQLDAAELDSLPTAIFDAVTVQALTLFTLAMSATVYALRVEAPATVADVFD